MKYVLYILTLSAVAGFGGDGYRSVRCIKTALISAVAADPNSPQIDASVDLNTMQSGIKQAWSWRPVDVRCFANHWLQTKDLRPASTSGLFTGPVRFETGQVITRISNPDDPNGLLQLDFTWRLPADYNHDGIVNLEDFNLLSRQWGYGWDKWSNK